MAGPGFASGCWVVEVECKFLIYALIEIQHTTSLSKGSSPPSISRGPESQLIQFMRHHAWLSIYDHRGYLREIV